MLWVAPWWRPPPYPQALACGERRNWLPPTRRTRPCSTRVRRSAPVFDGGAGRRGGLALRAVRGCGDGYQPSRGRRTIGLHGGNVVSNPSSSICAAHLARRALWSAGAAGDKAPVPLHWREVCRSVDDTRPADPLPALLRLQSRARGKVPLSEDVRGVLERWRAAVVLGGRGGRGGCDCSGGCERGGH